MGFGSSVIQRLVKTTIKKNLYYEIKEKVVEESFDGYRVSKNKKMVKVYGLDSTRDVRARLIEILYERVAHHKDKFIAPILYDEMSTMEVKKNGKVEHSDTTHDDQVFSYLMAMYVWYDGKNIMENFNIQKNVIKTDDNEDIEELEDSIEGGEKIEKIDLDDTNEVIEDELAQQLQYIKDSTRSMLQKQFDEALYEEEQQQLDYIMSTDRVFREAYNKKYHSYDDTSTRTMIMLPDEIFLDEEEIQMRSTNKNGNLFDIFSGL